MKDELLILTSLIIVYNCYYFVNHIENHSQEVPDFLKDLFEDTFDGLMVVLVNLEFYRRLFGWLGN